MPVTCIIFALKGLVPLIKTWQCGIIYVSRGCKPVVSCLYHKYLGGVVVSGVACHPIGTLAAILALQTFFLEVQNGKA